MPEMQVPVGAKKVTIAQVIIRCTCGDPSTNHPGSPCPGGERQDKGIVAYWHKNPLMRVGHWLGLVRS